MMTMILILIKIMMITVLIFYHHLGHKKMQNASDGIFTVSLNDRYKFSKKKPDKSDKIQYVLLFVCWTIHPSVNPYPSKYSEGL